MDELQPKICRTCGATADQKPLERCRMCSRYFCTDDVYRRGAGHRFCSEDCSNLYFYGDMDQDDQERLVDEDDFD